MMTNSEVRAAVATYYRIRDLLLHEPLAAGLRASLEGLLEQTEASCQQITGGSRPSRWARGIVGPVLAAGLGGAAYMREDVPTAGAALRVFGLGGERALSSEAAWKIMMPYSWEPVVSEKSLEEIRRRVSGLRLRLPKEPSPVDVIIELTRPRNSTFGVLVSRWLAEWFRDHSGPEVDTFYSHLFRSTIADLIVFNERGELAELTGAALARGTLTRDEWEELVHGRIPRSRLELRAGYLTTRQFITDYWQQWQETRPQALATG